MACVFGDSCQARTQGACSKNCRPPTTSPSSGQSLSGAGTSGSAGEVDVCGPTAGTTDTTTMNVDCVTPDDNVDDALLTDVDSSSRHKWLWSTTTTTRPASTTSRSTFSEFTSGFEHKTPPFSAIARQQGRDVVESCELVKDSSVRKHVQVTGTTGVFHRKSSDDVRHRANRVTFKLPHRRIYSSKNIYYGPTSKLLFLRSAA